MSAPQRGDRRLVSAQLLLDLVNDTLDPGYAAAARSRGGRSVRRWWDQPAVAVGCVLIGLLLVVSYVHTHRGAPEAKKVHDQLVARVRGATRGADELAGQLAKDEQALAAAQAKALPAADSRSLDRAREAAGQVAVSGPGLVVVLTEPKRSTAHNAGRVGSVPIAATTILTDRDVRSVVNELWHDGAEAVSVNGVRITPTSAIRFAGETVLVDYQPVTSPYTIRAIGNADDLSVAFAQSAVASRYQTLSGAEGVGFSFDTSDHLSLPSAAFPSLRYATVAGR